MFRKRHKKLNRTPNKKPGEAASVPMRTYYRGVSAPASGASRRSSKKEGKSLSNVHHYSFRAGMCFVWRFSTIGLIVLVVAYNFSLGGVGIKVNASGGTSGSSGGAGGGVFQSAQHYNAVAQDVFKASLRNRMKITLDSTAFEQAIMERLPEVRRAIAIVPLAGTQLQLNLEFAEPLIRIDLGNDQHGVIGTNGRLLYQSSALDIFDRFAGYAMVAIQPIVDTQPGDQILTTDEVSMLQLMLNELDGSESHRPKVEAVTYRISQRELQVDFESVDYYAKFTVERDAREQVGSLVASLKDLAKKNALPGEYIDVRVDGRIFVR